MTSLKLFPSLDSDQNKITFTYFPEKTNIIDRKIFIENSVIKAILCKGLVKNLVIIEIFIEKEKYVFSINQSFSEYIEFTNIKVKKTDNIYVILNNISNGDQIFIYLWLEKI